MTAASTQAGGAGAGMAGAPAQAGGGEAGAPAVPAQAGEGGAGMPVTPARAGGDVGGRYEQLRQEMEDNLRKLRQVIRESQAIAEEMERLLLATSADGRAGAAGEGRPGPDGRPQGEKRRAGSRWPWAKNR